MSSIINLHVGQCGNQIGSKFWEVISDEHGIDPSGTFQGDSDLQLQRINVFFNESSRGHYVPRAILADLEPGTLDSIRATPYGRLFSPDNFVSGQSGAANNFARGYLGAGFDLLDSLMDPIRREAEGCDFLNGFQLTHSLGGGTGSGLGTRVLAQLQDEYKPTMKYSYSIIPTMEVSETVVEPYNTLLSITHFLELEFQANVLMDNLALQNICSKTLKLAKPTFGDLNHLVAATMSGVTGTVRFPGQLNADLRKLAVNMVTFPRLHFFLSSFAPLRSIGAKKYRALSVPEVTQQLFDPANCMVGVDIRHGKFLSSCALFRGRLSTREVEEQMLNVSNQNNEYFANWIPDRVKISMCDIPMKGMKMSAVLLSTHTAIKGVFEKVASQVEILVKRKAYMHWYTSEGMEQDEFTEALSNVADLATEYAQHADNVEPEKKEEDEPPAEG